MLAAAPRDRLSAWLLASLGLHVVLSLGLGERVLDAVPAAVSRSTPEPVRVVVRAIPAPPAPTEAPPVQAPPPTPPEPPRVVKPVAKAPAVPRPPDPQPAAAPVALPDPQPAALPPVAAAPPAPPAGPTSEDLVARYKALLAELIGANKRYPALARRRGIEGDVKLRLRIDADGGLAQLDTVGRSHMLLAKQARRAAQQAAPFPPPPGGDFQIDFVLRFDLTD